MMKMIGPM